jgi:hypothetical protein
VTLHPAAQAASHQGQHHVVDRHVAGLGVLDSLEVAQRHGGEPHLAAGAGRAIQRGVLVRAPELAGRRARQAQRLGRGAAPGSRGQDGAGAANGARGAVAQGGGEQARRAGRRRRTPTVGGGRRALSGLRVPQDLGAQAQGRGAVGHAVVQLPDQRAAAALQLLHQVERP